MAADRDHDAQQTWEVQGMKPTVPLTNPAFRYTPSTHTDIRKTFERVRQEQAAAKKVGPIKGGK